MKTSSSKGNSRLKILIPVTLSTIIVIVAASLHVYFFEKRLAKEAKANAELQADCPSSLNLVREMDKELTHRLYLADVSTESQKYFSLKEQLAQIIQNRKHTGRIGSVSVYFRNMNDASWMSIDCDKNYYPGSLMKVPIMIYYLKKEEQHPGYLNRELLYTNKANGKIAQSFQGDSIHPNKKYKISELLYYMIAESDNNATSILGDNLEPKEFQKIFSDLELPACNLDNFDYSISPREFAKFFRVLYNTSYLGERLSEYALELLSKSKFNEGISRKLPSNLTIARKFGERTTRNSNDFSESAIVYLNDEPYLLTIMTEGNNVVDQTELISEISFQVFQSVAHN